MVNLYAWSYIWISFGSECFSCGKLRAQHVKVIFGWDPLDIALTHAVLLVTVEAWASWYICNACIKAKGCRCGLQLSLEMSWIVGGIFVLELDVKQVLKIQQLWPGTEEPVAMHISWGKCHCVLIILNEELDLLGCVLSKCVLIKWVTHICL